MIHVTDPGVDAIAARPIQSATGMPIVIHEHHTEPGVWGALGGLGALVLAAIGCWLWRERARKAFEAELALAAELRARSLEEADWHDEMAERRHRRPDVASSDTSRSSDS